MSDKDEPNVLAKINLPNAPRRASPRYPTKRSIDLRLEGWADFSAVIARNRSRNGLLLAIPLGHTPPRTGEAAQLRVTDRDGEPIYVDSMVVRVEGAKEEDEVARVAVTFGEAWAREVAGFLARGGVRRERPSSEPRPASRWKGARGPEGYASTREAAVEPADRGPSEGGTRERAPAASVEGLDEMLAMYVGAPSQGEAERAPAAEPRGAPSPAAAPAAGAAQGAPRPAEPPPAAPRAQRNPAVRPSATPPAGPAIVGKAAPPVAIDFGTTYSKVAVFEGGEVLLLEDPSSAASSRAAVPSVVALDRQGSWIVGEEARQTLATEPSSVISSVKRVMGLSYADPLAGGLLGSLACRSLAGPNDSVLFDLHGELITVPEVASRVIGHLVGLAAEHSGRKIDKAVLSMPVDFDRRARGELNLAAKMAGVEVTAMVVEPVAAAMGCGHDGRRDSLVGVYDFGGGTFDASLVKVGQGRFELLGAAGDRWLGGDDFDELLARHGADEFQSTTGVGLHNRAEEWQRLLFACEECKRWLSSLPSVDVILPSAGLGPDGDPLTLLVEVTRENFDDLTEDVITSALEVCRQACGEAGVSPHDVDQLFVTGGTTRIPAVRKAAERFFGRPSEAGIYPEHAVVIGAAIRSAALEGMTLPSDLSERLKAHGARSRTIGVALSEGVTDHVIDGRRPPPIAATRSYATSRDGQTRIRIQLMQGTSRLTEDNTPVGGFVIEGLPACPAGVVTVVVHFELSSTGTLFVTAQDRETGHRGQGSFSIDVD